MKRLLCLILFLVLSCSYACADVDYSSYSSDELKGMYDAISEELLKRGFPMDFVPLQSTGLGSQLPLLVLSSGEEILYYDKYQNLEDRFNASICNCSREDYDNYIECLKSYGFINDIQQSAVTFRASNFFGCRILLSFSETRLAIAAIRDGKE